MLVTSGHLDESMEFGLGLHFVARSSSPRDASVAEHDEPVGEVEDLRQIGRDEDHGLPLRRRATG